MVCHSERLQEVKNLHCRDIDMSLTLNVTAFTGET